MVIIGIAVCIVRVVPDGGGPANNFLAMTSLDTSIPLRPPAFYLRYIVRQCHESRPELFLASNQNSICLPFPTVFCFRREELRMYRSAI